MKFNNLNIAFTEFATGAGILALEILASRYMLPAFGTSIFIWGAVLSVTLLYLAIGYQWGGLVAARLEDPYRRLALHIIIAAAWIGLIGFFGPPLLHAGLQLGAMLGPIFVALVLLGPPLILLSTAVPLGIGVVDANAKGGIRASEIAGRLFAISTVGSIVGALLTAYLLLPQIGVTRSLFVVSVCLVLMTVPQFGNRKVHASAVLAVVLLLAVKFITEPAELKKGLVFLERTATPYGQVDVIADYRDNSRILLIDGASQNHVSGEGWADSKFEYVDTVVEKAGRLLGVAAEYAGGSAPETDLPATPKATQTGGESPAALVLGMGAGTLARQLTGLGYAVEQVEIDPYVLEVAVSYFSFPQDHVSAVQIKDARAFLEEEVSRNSRQWDLIVVDLAGGGVHPEHVYTFEAYAAIRSLLAPGGLVAVNFVSYVAPPGNNVLMHSAATLARLFDHVEVYSLYPDRVSEGEMGQALIFASDLPVRDVLFSPAEVEGNLVAFDEKLSPLTDDWNPMANWSVLANATWHENIIKWLGAGVLVPH